MVCRVKDKEYFSFAFLFALFSFYINSVFFFLTVFFIRCSHCRKLAPTWKALAEYHKDKYQGAVKYRIYVYLFIL